MTYQPQISAKELIKPILSELITSAIDTKSYQHFELNLRVEKNYLTLPKSSLAFKVRSQKLPDSISYLELCYFPILYHYPSLWWFPGFAMMLPNVILCSGTNTMTSASNDINIRIVTLVVCAFWHNMSKIMNKVYAKELRVITSQAK